MTARGLTLGSLGILQVEGGHQSFVVRGNGFAVFPEALDITGDGVPGHFFGFGERPPVGHATGQRRHQRRISPLGLRPENNIEMPAAFLHEASLHQNATGISRLAQTPGLWGLRFPEGSGPRREFTPADPFQALTHPAGSGIASRVFGSRPGGPEDCGPERKPWDEGPHPLCPPSPERGGGGRGRGESSEPIPQGGTVGHIISPLPGLCILPGVDFAVLRR